MAQETLLVDHLAAGALPVAETLLRNAGVVTLIDYGRKIGLLAAEGKVADDFLKVNWEKLMAHKAYEIAFEMIKVRDKFIPRL